MLDFSLRQLEVFVAVAEYGSFTHAAEALYLTQSTVSTHIRDLETALGTPLFARGARKKISLTEAGRQIYLAARDILTQCERLHEICPEDQMPLSIGASTVPAQCLLPDLLSGFVRQQPSCRFLLKRGDSMQVHRLLQRSEVQVGFVGVVLDKSIFQYYPVQKDRLILATAAEILLQEPFLARETNSGTWQATVKWLTGRNIPLDRLQIVARMETPEAIRRAVVRGLGVSIQSALMAADDIAAGRLLGFDLEPNGIWRDLYLVVPRGAGKEPLRDEFIHFVRQTVAAER